MAFDNDLNIPGVTVIDQDDYSLAWKTLKTLAEDLNGEGNIVTIWVGGFTPMERRHVIYEAFKNATRTLRKSPNSAQRAPTPRWTRKRKWKRF